MILATHQSGFLPYAGYFHKILLSDKFIITQNLENNRENYGHRVKVGGSWFTNPINKAQSGKTFDTVVVVPNIKNLKTLKYNYPLAKVKNPEFFARIIDIYASYVGVPVPLVHLNRLLMDEILDLLGLSHKVEYKHVPDHIIGDDAASRTLGYMDYVAGGEEYIYLSGAGGRNYLQSGATNHIFQKFVGQEKHLSTILDILKDESPSECLVTLLSIFTLERY